MEKLTNPAWKTLILWDQPRSARYSDKRWTPARKRDIIDSRVQAARVLAQAFIRTGHKPQAYISASAIGFYGNSGDRVMTEADAPVDDGFMVDCCRQWELAADTVQQHWASEP